MDTHLILVHLQQVFLMLLHLLFYQPLQLVVQQPLRLNLANKFYVVLFHPTVPNLPLLEQAALTRSQLQAV